MRNFQRDGLRQMVVPKGRVAYEPNSLDQSGPRETATRGFTPFSAAGTPETLSAEKTRRRADTFADHYSQARQLFRSLTPPEQTHVCSAFAFELGKVETKAIRRRMLGHLRLVDTDLATTVESALGMEGQADTITAAVEPRDLPTSPALSIIAKAPATLEGRKIGVLLTNGFDESLLEELRQGATKEKAALAIIAPKVGGALNSKGKLVEVDFALSAAPSFFFDAVVVLASADGIKPLVNEAAAREWVANAFSHLKVIGHTTEAGALLKAGGVKTDAGVVTTDDKAALRSFLATAKKGRIWDREPKLRSPG